MSANHFVIERQLKAAPEKVWAMWTTKNGLEKWWAPIGFRSEVKHLDVRVGGRFEIEMTAVAPEIVDFLKKQGIPVTSSAKGDYTELEAPRLIAYQNSIDFVPGVAPYKPNTRVTFAAEGAGTRLTIANDLMHDAHWTEMAKQGWEQQVDKLVKLFD